MYYFKTTKKLQIQFSSTYIFGLSFVSNLRKQIYLDHNLSYLFKVISFDIDLSQNFFFQTQPHSYHSYNIFSIQKYQPKSTH